jgi:cysteine-rich repeat protein
MVEIITIVLICVAFFVIGLLISITFLSVSANFNPTNVSTSVSSTYTGVADNFDYTTYLLTKNPVNIGTYDSCDKLKTAIKNAILTGKPYKVDEITYGNDLESSLLWPIIGNCPEEEIETEIAGGLKQKLCHFVTNNVVFINNASDVANLYFGECSYSPFEPDSSDRYLVLEGETYNPIVDQWTVGYPDILYSSKELTFFSPDYLYMRNGDYSNPPLNLNNNTAFSNAYNGPGRLKIYVGNASSIGGNCTYNIYFCFRPAIAKSKENSTITIFNLFRNLELYDLKFIPYYIRDLSRISGYDDISGFSKRVYYWNYYDIKLDGDYKVETIINAIKSGLYENVLGRGYFWAHPHWDVSRDNSTDKAGECWNSNYDDLIKPDSKNSRTRSIRFNCNDDNICGGELRIKIALRYDIRKKDINSDGEDETLDYISGVISFCSGKRTVARFTESSTTVTLGGSITFDASSSTAEGSIVSYEWDFGDGTTDTGMTVTHSYSTTGTFTVKLTITDIEGAKASKTETKWVYDCGNNVIEYPEQCDDGNSDNNDACKNDCTWNVCRDGFIRTGVEDCDDGNNINTDDCKNDCTWNICVDGVVHDTAPFVHSSQEQCDDGNSDNNDDCKNDCTLNICGDGFIYTGVEQCDPAALPTGCNLGETCKAAGLSDECKCRYVYQFISPSSCSFSGKKGSIYWSEAVDAGCSNKFSDVVSYDGSNGYYFNNTHADNEVSSTVIDYHAYIWQSVGDHDNPGASRAIECCFNGLCNINDMPPTGRYGEMWKSSYSNTGWPEWVNPILNESDVYFVVDASHIKDWKFSNFRKAWCGKDVNCLLCAEDTPPTIKGTTFWIVCDPNVDSAIGLENVGPGVYAYAVGETVHVDYDDSGIAYTCCSDRSWKTSCS